jgi:hypothetical protein
MEAGFGQKLVGLSCPPRFEAHLVLGSGSPRRKELLALLGFPFSVRTADTDELAPAGLSDLETVQYVARQKAEALVPGLLHGEVVLTADTEVWMDGERFGKPASTQEALTIAPSWPQPSCHHGSLGDGWKTLGTCAPDHRSTYGRLTRKLAFMVCPDLSTHGQGRCLRRTRVDRPYWHRPP